MEGRLSRLADTAVTATPARPMTSPRRAPPADDTRVATRPIRFLANSSLVLGSSLPVQRPLALHLDTRTRRLDSP
eukprot:scaffold20134_cov66-Phaeocystis_antarctica.AAC.4